MSLKKKLLIALALVASLLSGMLLKIARRPHAAPKAVGSAVASASAARPSSARTRSVALHRSPARHGSMRRSSAPFARRSLQSCANKSHSPRW